MRAPDVWFDILELAGERLVPLHELAEIRRGFTSGADKFYCVRDVTDEQLKRYPNPAEFKRVWGTSREDAEKVRIIRDGDGGLHLDEAVLEMIGIEAPAQRADIQRRIYDAIQEQYTATRQRELVAQRHRRQSQRNGAPSATDMADEIWEEPRDSLGLLQFPEVFVRRWTSGATFDLPDGQVEVGTAMTETGRQLRVGTIRVGGSTDPMLDVGSLEKARFLQALAECGRCGSVRVPDDKQCEDAYQEFTRYKQELARRFVALATQRSRDQRRQRQIVAALMRKALAWH